MEQQRIQKLSLLSGADKIEKVSHSVQVLQCHSVTVSLCLSVISNLGQTTAGEEPGEEAGGCHAAEERTTGVHEVSFLFSIINQSSS